MVPTCGVCATNDSKYKCPICELRYCSIPCYKSHKAAHEAEKSTKAPETKEEPLPPVASASSTKQRAPKLDFTGFENSQDLQRLLSRFPNLRYQLQLVYGITLEPGPDEGSSWSRRDWFPDGREGPQNDFRDRGRGGRGRGRGRGGRYIPEVPFDTRLRGPWTQEKGDQQGVDTIHKMRATNNPELAEGMNEFVQLCQIKFGRPK